MAATTTAESLKWWVAEVELDQLAAVASIRLDEGVELAFSSAGSRFWLRGKRASLGVLSLPFSAIYQRRSEYDEELVPLGARLPSGRLPQDLEWVPVCELVIPRKEAADFPRDEFYGRVPLRITRGGLAAEVNLLRVSRESWLDYVETAPQIRLERLSFAACDVDVLVRGWPLPSIPGEGWVLRDRVELRVGYQTVPLIESAILQRVIGLTAMEIALISPLGVVERITEEQFIPASRASVRLSMI